MVTWVSMDSPRVYASNRIKGKMYLLWKLYFGLFDNATEVPPQKAKRKFAMFNKSQFLLLSANPQQEIIAFPSRLCTVQFGIIVPVLKYQHELQHLRGFLHPNIQILRFLVRGQRREIKNPSKVTETVKEHFGDFGRVCVKLLWFDTGRDWCSCWHWAPSVSNTGVPTTVPVAASIAGREISGIRQGVKMCGQFQASTFKVKIHKHTKSLSGFSLACFLSLLSWVSFGTPLSNAIPYVLNSFLHSWGFSKTQEAISYSVSFCCIGLI